MEHKYAIGTLVYSAYDCLGVIVHIYDNRYVKSKYVVEWDCPRFYGSYTEYEIDDLRQNLQTKLDES